MGCVFRNRFWLCEQLFQREENGQDKTASLNSHGTWRISKVWTLKPPCPFCGFCHCCWENTVPSQGMNFFQLGGNWDLPRATLNQSFKVCPIYLSLRKCCFTLSCGWQPERYLTFQIQVCLEVKSCVTSASWSCFSSIPPSCLPVLLATFCHPFISRCHIHCPLWLCAPVSLR